MAEVDGDRGPRRMAKPAAVANGDVDYEASSGRDCAKRARAATAMSRPISVMAIHGRGEESCLAHGLGANFSHSTIRSAFGILRVKNRGDCLTPMFLGPSII